MSNEWLRLWHDMPTDPKWRTIARVSGQRIGDVMSVYVFLLVSGSANATERGRTQSFNAEDVATALDLETTAVESIVTAMQGRVLTGDMLRGWVGRQPVREDGASERAKAWREAQKQAKRTQPNAERTQPNADERKRSLDTDTDTDTDTEEAKAKDSTTCLADSPSAEPAVSVPSDKLATRRKRTTIPCPVARIAELWDEVLPELSSPIVWNDARRTAVSTRWREMAVFNGWTDQSQGIDFFRKTFNAIRGSPFLMGKVPPRDRNGKPFALTLDWMFGPKNFIKVVEGEYHKAR